MSAGRQVLVRRHRLCRNEIAYLAPFMSQFVICSVRSNKHRLTQKTSVMFIALLVVFGSCLMGARTETSGLPSKWNVRYYPNPRRSFQQCGRYSQSWICDPNELLLERDANEINDMLSRVNAETVCSCPTCVSKREGFPIMVAVMPEMQKILNRSDSLDDLMVEARLFAYYLTERYKFGECEDALTLILFVQESGIAYTITRPKAREKITDEHVSQVTLDAWDYFQSSRRGSVAFGLKQMIQDYKDILLNRYERRTPIPPRTARRRSYPSSGTISNAPGVLTVLVLLVSGLVNKLC
ncbi:hypothetical protein ScPMuIL_012792 [Solemya velum]